RVVVFGRVPLRQSKGLLLQDPRTPIMHLLQTLLSLSEAPLKSIIAMISIVFAAFFTLAQRPATAPLTYERLRNAPSETQNWLMYWGNYQGTHFSSLKQIDKSNVDRFQHPWTRKMSGRGSLQSTPLVVDGVMYTSGAPGSVYALEAK